MLKVKFSTEAMENNTEGKKPSWQGQDWGKEQISLKERCTGCTSP